MPTDTTRGQGDITAPPCTPQRLCRRTRTCPRCARIKQAEAGNLAERLEKYFGPLYLTVLKPEQQTPEALVAVRKRWVALSKVPAALWSIEEGDKLGTLHTNIIHPVCKPAHPRNTLIHTEKCRESPRVVAAYITKLSQAPSHERYPGRTFGRCGHLLSFLATNDEFPVVQAAAINELLSEPNQKDAGRYAWNRPEPPPQLTPEEYKEIAKRHLPNLAALLHSLKTTPPK